MRAGRWGEETAAALLLAQAASKGVTFWLSATNELHYRGPAGALAGPEIEQLRACRDQVIELLKKPADARAPASIAAATRPDVLPVSFEQERLFFLEQLGLVGPAYHIQIAIGIEGVLDAQALASGLREIARRHEILRTHFTKVAGLTRQVIDAAPDDVLAVIDLSHLPAEARQESADSTLHEARFKPFELATGPLWRTLLLRLSPARHTLLLVAHHLILDGWSVNVLLSELRECYEAQERGEAPRLAPLPVQYADYALWQRSERQTRVYEQQLQYWTTQLAHAPAALELPTDRPRPATPSYGGGMVMFEFGEELSKRLVEFARQEGVTLYMLLLAGFQTLLSRYSGQHDVVVGAPVAGRGHAQLEGLIGFFINTLALRVNLDGDPDFRDLLGRVKQATLDAYANQDVPFEKVVAQVRRTGELSRQALFQVAFSLERAGQGAARLSNLKLQALEGEYGTAKFDLTLFVYERSEGLSCGFEYATDLFDRSTIERFARHFERVFQDALDGADRPVSQLPSLTAAEHEELLARQQRASKRDMPAERGARPPFAPPVGVIEQRLAQIWCEVLNQETPGRDDHFFERGGHSLLAMLMVARISDAFGIELPLKTLFEAPTIARFAAHIEQARAGNEPQAAPLSVQRGAVLPLSFAQERLWFLEQLGVGSAYTMSVAVRIEGALNIAVLERGFRCIVERHEVLRTRFEMHGEEGAQVIQGAREFSIAVLDLSGLEAGEARAQAIKVTLEDAQRRFDLRQGGLFRVSALRLRQDEHVVVICMHHIVSDSWSMSLLLNELRLCYEAYASAAEPALPPLPVQYADYAVWQRGEQQAALFERQLAYWRKQLADAPAGLGWPTDRPRPAMPSFRGGMVNIDFGAELSQQLLQLGRRENVTLYMLFLAAFQLLLSKYSGQNDVVVGSPIAGRTRRETQNLIGFFLNTLALRTDLSGDPSFADLLRRVKQVTLDAYAHQDVPFEKVVAQLQAAGELSRQALFQVMYTLESVSQEGMEFGGLKLSGLPVEFGTAKFDMTLFVYERPESLSCAFEYAADLFDQSTIERLAQHFKVLLQGIAANAALPLSRLSLLSELQRTQLLVLWNDTRRELDERGIQACFEAQVLKTPRAPAVTCEGQTLTYVELNAWANQVAHYLIECGVGPDTLVAVCLERSVAMMVAVLGILKAGGGYVPIDPLYPSTRIDGMLADAKISLVLTQRELLSRFDPTGAPIRFCALDEQQWHNYSDDNPPVRTVGQNIAYCIYTSGSTGQPKGVLIDQRSASASVQARLAYYKAGAGERMAMLLIPSIAFDSSVAVVFWALLSGAELILPSEPAAADPWALGRLIQARQVTHWLSTPSLYQALLETGAPLESLRTVVVAGEELSIAVWQAHGQRTSVQCVLYNEYGTTEVAVWSTVTRLPPYSDEAVAACKTIGWPIDNTQLYVLDSDLNPVAVGVPGELFIGGTGVARGYLNRPGLTAQRFIPNPYSDAAGARLYRTGDRVRYLPDGSVQFLGRIDRQIKLRGFRIELAEIETRLSAHPAIREAVVVVREDSPEQRRLVAYVIPEGELDIADVRRELAQVLPEHMIPAAYVRLDRFPLSTNGKIDRRRLPAPGIEAFGERSYEAPQGELEVALAAIWCELLRVQRVGRNDNFFELGGHSLLVMGLVARVEETFGVQLPMRSIFEAPVIARLVDKIIAATLDESGGSDIAQLLDEVTAA